MQCSAVTCEPAVSYDSAKHGGTQYSMGIEAIDVGFSWVRPARSCGGTTWNACSSAERRALSVFLRTWAKFDYTLYLKRLSKGSKLLNLRLELRREHGPTSRAEGARFERGLLPYLPALVLILFPRQQQLTRTAAKDATDATTGTLFGIHRITTSMAAAAFTTAGCIVILLFRPLDGSINGKPDSRVWP